MFIEENILLDLLFWRCVMKVAKLWLKVSSDQYELPLAVADSAVELATLCGVTVNTIYAQMSRVRAGTLSSCPYICVVL